MQSSSTKKPPGTEEVCSPIMEKHFLCKELAELWHLSETTVFNLFVDEEGVLKIGERSSRKRTKISVRIPLSVAERVYKRLKSA